MSFLSCFFKEAVDPYVTLRDFEHDFINLDNVKLNLNQIGVILSLNQSVGWSLNLIFKHF